MSYFFFESADGTRLRGWANGNEGVAAVLVPGVAGTPDAYPSLQASDTGLRVYSSFMRGTHGSDQPGDPRSVTLSDHVADLVALMDSRGLDKALMVGGGYGVDIVFQLLKEHPERVQAILAIAGAPILPGVTPPESLSLHEKLLFPVTRRVTSEIRRLAPTLGQSSRAEQVASILRKSKVLATQATTEDVTRLLETYADVDPDWFDNLIEGAQERCEIAPEAVTVPVTFLLGDEDSILSSAGVRNTSLALPNAKIHEVHGGLLLGVEQPAAVSDQLLELADRIGLNPMEYLSRSPEQRLAAEDSASDS